MLEKKIEHKKIPSFKTFLKTNNICTYFLLFPFRGALFELSLKLIYNFVLNAYLLLKSKFIISLFFRFFKNKIV